MDALTLDGNALAGLLREVFEADLTSALGTCDACEATEPIGAVSREEFAHYSADDRQAAGCLGPRDDEWDGRRQAQLEQRLGP